MNAHDPQAAARPNAPTTTYRYDEFDAQFVRERVAEFREQVRRRLEGSLTEDEFRPFRLMNGLYLQLHAYMLRVAIPYGTLTARQMRRLADIADRWDKGYGHFTTRQNLQYNWPKLIDTPDILDALAEVEMHAIQTSGNCIRNVTSDQFAGVAHDEILDPRPLAELIRQWSTFHPEFAYLPRKFKIAVSAATEDRAATWFHDIGLQFYWSDEKSAQPRTATENIDTSDVRVRVIVGGGLGRTPIVGQLIHGSLPAVHLFTYLDAILRTYNRFGRRDNMYKARIKILVKELGLDRFRQEVEREWQHLKDGPSTLPAEELKRVAGHFVDPDYKSLSHLTPTLDLALSQKPAFARWAQRAVFSHKRVGYAAVTLSLKPNGIAPGDITADQLDAVADLAERYSFGEVRISHEQNVILADVERERLPALWEELRKLGLATPNVGLLTDIISCPGGDFCSLANAKSIPVANAIQQHVEEKLGDLDYLFDIGEISLNISGCMNACGHHHIGNIGILGVDKHGEEFYQVTIGGEQGVRGRTPSLGRVIGPSFARAEMADVIEKLVRTYVDLRHADEAFVDTVSRVGVEPFKRSVYNTEGSVYNAAGTAATRSATSPEATDV